MIIPLSDNPINGIILTKAFSISLAFLHTLEIWSSKFSFQSGLKCQVISHYFQSQIH